MKCEVVGWLFEDAEKPQLLVRNELSKGDPHPVSLDSTVANQAIQTGSFLRAPVIDPVTRQMVGFELEPLPSPYVTSI
jgi:hypothetical protein